MTAFVESCLETVADSAEAAERRARGRPRARHLLAALAGKKNILLTTHLHPDPDALGSAAALKFLLEQRLSVKETRIIKEAAKDGDKDSGKESIREAADGRDMKQSNDGKEKDAKEPKEAKDPREPKDAKGESTIKPQITLSIKGTVGGGMNDAFLRVSNLKPTPWDEAAIAGYDAIVLLDTQPQFTFSPLPPGVKPTAVIDHHRGRGRKPECPFCDIRTDAGSTSSIVFSYFMELEVAIRKDLAATLLYAIESDLAGAAGTPGELDNLALSSLTLIADPRKLYQMRYVDLPQTYFAAYSQALSNAVFLESALMTHLDSVDSLEQPAVMADFLLRFDKVEWALVTAVHELKLILSLRTSNKDRSAADVMRRVLRKVGEGGGHKTKAGGYVDLAGSAPPDLDKLRGFLWRRYLRALGMKVGKGQKLVPR